MTSIEYFPQQSIKSITGKQTTEYKLVLIGLRLEKFDKPNKDIPHAQTFSWGIGDLSQY
jgi:hypothetical protein